MKNRSVILTAILSLLAYSGFLSTALAATPPPGIQGNVTVVNTAAEPVPVTGTVSGTITGTVTDADNPARHAVQQDFTLSDPSSTGVSTSTIAIPAKKIFVIEYVSWAVNRPAVGDLLEVEVGTTGPKLDGTTGTVFYDMVIPPPSSGSSLGNVGGQVVRLYAQPGTTLTVRAGLTASQQISGSVSISGYFVSSP